MAKLSNLEAMRIARAHRERPSIDEATERMWVILHNQREEIGSLRSDVEGLTRLVASDFKEVVLRELGDLAANSMAPAIQEALSKLGQQQIVTLALDVHSIRMAAPRGVEQELFAKAQDHIQGRMTAKSRRERETLSTVYQLTIPHTVVSTSVVDGALQDAARLRRMR